MHIFVTTILATIITTILTLCDASGHGFELVSKLVVLKQRIQTYCTLPAVQYYLQSGRRGNITDLQSELAKLEQLQRDIEKVMEGVGSVESGSITGLDASNEQGLHEKCFQAIRQSISTGMLLQLRLYFYS